MSAHLLIARALAGLPPHREPQTQSTLQHRPSVRPGLIHRGIAAAVIGGRQVVELLLQRRAIKAGRRAAGHGGGSEQTNDDAVSVPHTRG